LAGVLTPTEITSLEIHLSNYDFGAALSTLSKISSRLALDLMLELEPTESDVRRENHCEANNLCSG